MEKLTYNAQEVATVLGVSKSHVYQLLKENRLPVLKLGRRKVVPISALEQWIQDNMEQFMEKPLL